MAYGALKKMRQYIVVNVSGMYNMTVPKLEEVKIAVVGLGYVGLPLVLAFGKEARVPVFGFDTNVKRVEELQREVDRNAEYSANVLQASTVTYSADPTMLRQANFLIIAVPTPINKAKQPDLRPVEGAAEIVGTYIQKGSVVVLESTVYPGVTEEVMAPIIERISGLKYGSEWKVGYSPERINPGDHEHTIDKVIKIVSGMDEETLDVVAAVYGIACKAGVHRAPNIKTAEAAKIIENVQRDLNIALMNELSLIFHRIGINTREVLEAAGTKWNFHKYQPGLVGGHCYAGSHRITLLNGQSHEVRTMLDYYNELQVRKIVRRENVGETILLWPNENISVLSFNKDSGKAVFAPAKCFSMREGGAGLRITAAGNHHIEVSARHPMIIDNDGQWFVKHAQDIQVGDRVPLLQDLPQRHHLRTEIDLIYKMPKEWHRRYRVKRKAGTWREFKDIFEIKKHTGRKASNFYHLDYLPLTVYLALERKGVMPVSHEEIVLVSGRGGGSFQTVPAVITLDADFARLVGYYLSEGCITYDNATRVRFTFNRNEKETIADCIWLIKKLGVQRYSRFENHQCNATHLKVSSELVGFLFEKVLFLGVRSEDARIPEEFLYAKDAIRWNVLTGLLRGDGGVDWHYSHHPYQKNGKTYAHARNIANVSYFSISAELFHGVQLLLMSFGIPFTLDKNRPLLEIQGTKYIAKVRECFIDEKRKKLEGYFTHKIRAPKSKIFKSYDGYVTVPVLKIEPTTLSAMYSVEIEGTHTVVTDGGFMTHNCIGVDPYYLTQKAEELGYHPQVILAGRRINDGMAEYVADLMVRGLIEAGKVIRGSKVLVLGLTFKEDIRDTRNSKIRDTITALQSYGIIVCAHDPLLTKDEVEEFGVTSIHDLATMDTVDGVMLATVHKQFRHLTLNDIVPVRDGNGRMVFVDIKSWFLPHIHTMPKPLPFIYRCL